MLSTFSCGLGSGYAFPSVVTEEGILWCGPAVAFDMPGHVSVVDALVEALVDEFARRGVDRERRGRGVGLDDRVANHDLLTVVQRDPHNTEAGPMKYDHKEDADRGSYVHGIPESIKGSESGTTVLGVEWRRADASDHRDVHGRSWGDARNEWADGVRREYTLYRRSNCGDRDNCDHCQSEECFQQQKFQSIRGCTSTSRHQ